MRTTPAVTVPNLQRRYGQRTVLEGLDLTILKGEFVALLGESGCGKTTLLRALPGLDPVDGGQIDGPRQPAVVFQEHRLLPWAILIRELVARHQPGVVLATHNVDEAIAIADRILIMRDGEIAASYRWPTHAGLRQILLHELGVENDSRAA